MHLSKSSKRHQVLEGSAGEEMHIPVIAMVAVGIPARRQEHVVSAQGILNQLFCSVSGRGGPGCKNQIEDKLEETCTDAIPCIVTSQVLRIKAPGSFTICMHILSESTRFRKPTIHQSTPRKEVAKQVESPLRCSQRSCHSLTMR